MDYDQVQVAQLDVPMWPQFIMWTIHLEIP